MKKKLLITLAIVLSLVMVIGVFAACDCGPAPEPVTYVVTFDANNGTLTGNSTVTVEKDGTITGAPTAARDGYTFNGWFTAATGGTEVTLSSYKVTAAVTLYAQWTAVAPASYTVTFNANGGTLTGSGSVNINAGALITGAPTATRSNYTFKGWFTAATGGTEIVLSSYKVTAAVTLYAQWTEVAPASYTVTFNANGGTLTGSGTVNINAGALITGAPTAARSGYDFTGWSTTASGTVIDLSTYKVNSAITLYAQWNEVQTGGTGMPITAITGGYMIEAEDALVTGAPSQEGSDYIETAATASGGKSLGFLSVLGNTVTFNFYSATAGTANVLVYMSSGAMETTNWTITDQIIKSTQIAIKVNDAAQPFEDATLRGSNAVSSEADAWNKYWDPVTVSNAPIKAGLNTIVVESLDGTFPNFDRIEIMTSLVLSESGGGPVNPGGTEMPIAAITGGYMIEAEDAVITGTPSQEGSDYIETVETASGGKSLGYLSVLGNTVTFNFISAAAGTANLLVYMSSGALETTNFTIIDQIIKSTQIAIKMNDATQPFEDATLRGSNAVSSEAGAWNKYWDPVTVSNAPIKAGLNTIAVESLDGTFPNFDRLEIMTSLVLSKCGGSGPVTPPETVSYTGDISFDLVIGAYPGGPAIEKAIICFDDAIAATALSSGQLVVRNASGAALGTTSTVYLSDAEGDDVQSATSKYVTIEYAIVYNGASSSFNGNLSPFTYSNMNVWNNLSAYTVALAASKTITIGGTAYTSLGTSITFGKKIIPSMQDWDTSGTHTKGDITLKYGAYEPAAIKNDSVKNPLIIWLHGMGEGGTDPSIAVLGNQITNLSDNLVQKYFKDGSSAGAYVLAPQSPTMWMDGIYNPALWSLIKAYVAENGDIDENRIYIGGCSNGGYMTIDMLLTDTDGYFAAYFPICEAYSANITPEQLNMVKNRNIWITHSLNDPTVTIVDSTNPTGWSPELLTDEDGNYIPISVYSNKFYIDMLAAGATNTHYSLFNSVTVDGVNYNGHWSWIYTLLDLCTTVQAKTGTGAGGAFTLDDFDPDSTATVQIGGKNVSIWEWMAAQRKQA